MVNQTTTAVTTVSAQAVGSSNILLNYSGLPGNQPANFGNTAFLWQSPFIPYDMPPLAMQLIPNNVQNGTVNIGNLQLQMVPYIVGYAVGPETANICSSVSIAADGSESAFQTSIQVVEVTPQLIAVQYVTPPGNQPSTYGQQIGLWQGPYASFTQQPIASARVTGNTSQGSMVLQAMIMVGMTYSVGYLMGQRPTTLAASCTFTT